MLYGNLETLKSHCISIDRNDVLSELYWELDDDDSEFVCAQTSYESDNKIYYFNVWTENYAYCVKDVETATGNVVVCTKVKRNPNGIAS